MHPSTLLLALSLLPAQIPAPPQYLTLDDLLLRLQQNLVLYQTTVPSFFCDEHAVSSSRHRFAVLLHRDTVTESVFRLKRTLTRDRRTQLDESRQIRTVDGVPAQGEEINGPTLLSGAFSGGLAVVSVDQHACMRYTLDPPNAGLPEPAPYIVRFATVPRRERPPDCILREDATGRALIDPATLQISRIEVTIPRHVILPGSLGTGGHTVQQVEAVWSVSVEYARVLLGNKPFWMPRTITSIATSSGSDPIVWTFTADYTNYHKLDVTSHLIPIP